MRPSVLLFSLFFTDYHRMRTARIWIIVSEGISDALFSVFSSYGTFFRSVLSSAAARVVAFFPFSHSRPASKATIAVVFHVLHAPLRLFTSTPSSHSIPSLHSIQSLLGVLSLQLTRLFLDVRSILFSPAIRWIPFTPFKLVVTVLANVVRFVPPSLQIPMLCVAVCLVSDILPLLTLQNSQYLATILFIVRKFDPQLSLDNLEQLCNDAALKVEHIAQIGTIQAQIQALEAQARSLQQSHTQHQAELHNTILDNTLLAGHTDRVVRERHVAQQERDVARGELAQAQVIRDQARQERDDTVRMWQERNAPQTQRVEELQAIGTELVRQRIADATLIMDLRPRVDSLRREVSDYRDNVRSTRAQVTDLQQELGEAQHMASKARGLRKANKQWRRMARQLGVEIKERRAETEEIQETHSLLGVEHEHLALDRDQIAHRRDQAADELERTRDEADDQRDALEDSAARGEKLRSALEESENRRAELSSVLQLARDVDSRYRQRFEQIVQDNADLRSALEEATEAARRAEEQTFLVLPLVGGAFHGRATLASEALTVRPSRIQLPGGRRTPEFVEGSSRDGMGLDGMT